MAKREVRNLLVGLDIGTTKCVAVIGQVMPEGGVDIVGHGEHASRGLNRGEVVNIDATVQAIRRAVENAEHMANCRAQSVYVGLSGQHIQSGNSLGLAAIRQREVTDRDVDAAIETAKAIPMPADRRILHVIPQEFVIDGQRGIQDPVGQYGVRLEANVHVIHGSSSSIQNLSKCVEACGLRVDRLILQHLAAAEAVLLPDEREAGVVSLDIGGGTSDIAVFKGGAIRHTAVLPVAGNHVTNDVAMAFRIPAQQAEEIKVQFGCALPQLAAAHEEIEIRGVGEGSRRLSRLTLAEVVRPRYEELFRFVRKELQRSGWYESIPAGVVLSGAAVQMPGVAELAEEVFELPVRIGVPQQVTGIDEVVGSPAYATAAGLLLYGRHAQPRSDATRAGGGGGASFALQRISEWLKGNF